MAHFEAFQTSLAPRQLICIGDWPPRWRRGAEGARALYLRPVTPSLHRSVNSHPERVSERDLKCF